MEQVHTSIGIIRSVRAAYPPTLLNPIRPYVYTIGYSVVPSTKYCKAHRHLSRGKLIPCRSIIMDLMSSIGF